MTVIPVRLDTWINEAPNRRDQPYGDTNFVQIMAGTDARRRAFIKPDLGNISGRLVVDAPLYGHAGKGGNPAATVTVAPVLERWQAGRLTWDSTDPNGGPPVDTARQVTMNLPATPEGGLVTFPGLASMVQAVADGTAYEGFRITTTSTTALTFAASDSGLPAFELDVILSELTDAAVNLAPDGGAVPVQAPVLSWEVDDQTARQIQIDSHAEGVEPSEATLNFDSTLETSTSREFDLAASSFTPVGPGPHSWRVGIPGNDGLTDWSDWAEFTVASLPALVVDSPVGAFGDPSPTVIADLATGTLDHWRVLVTGPNRADVRVDSGRQTGPLSFNVPERVGGRQVLVEGEGGWIYIEAHDTTDRAVAVGAPDYAYAWVPVEFAQSLGVTPPSSLLVSQVAPGDPRHQWRWQRAEAADAWLIQVDGRTVKRLDAADVTVSGGFYTWNDNGEIPPLEPHALSVCALEDGLSSLPVERHDQSHLVEGVWVLPTGDTGEFFVNGTGVEGFVETERRATFEPLVGPPIDIIYDSNPGRTGNMPGTIDSRQDVWEVKRRIKALRKARDREARLVWGSESILARIVDPDVSPSPEILPSTLTHDVRFGFVQVGD